MASALVPIVPNSSYQKGARLERETARIMGGKRMPLSGAQGGGDIRLPAESIYNDWLVEAKSRARLPAYFSAAMKQAELECKGTRKRPAIILREDRGKIMVAFLLEDFVQWSSALAEMGQGQKVKSLVRDARRVLDQIEGLAK